MQGTAFSGPLPPPEMLVRYNDAVPGAADRIIAMAESNQKHRHALEATVIPSKARNESRGQIFGFIIAVLFIFCGTYLISIDKDVAGLSVLAVNIATLVGMFLYVDFRKRKELQRNRGE